MRLLLVIYQRLPPDMLVIVDNSGLLENNVFASDIPFKVVILSPGYNTGYSVGANLGVSLAISLYPEAFLLLLSPDILFPENNTIYELMTIYAFWVRPLSRMYTDQPR